MSIASRLEIGIGSPDPRDTLAFLRSALIYGDRVTVVPTPFTDMMRDLTRAQLGGDGVRVRFSHPFRGEPGFEISLRRAEIDALVEVLSSQLLVTETDIPDGLTTSDDLVEWLEDDVRTSLKKPDDAEAFARRSIERIFGLVDLAYFRRVIPLLDGDTAEAIDMVTSAIPAERRHSVRRGARAAIAVNLLDRLPGFSEASLDEVVDLRRELAPFLIPFRSAVATFAGEIEAEPYTTEFLDAVDELYERDVAPALQAITEAVHDNSSVREIALRATTESKAILAATAGIALGVAGVGAAPPLISAGLGVGAATGALAMQSVAAVRARRKAIEGNKLFLLHQANVSLAARLPREPN